MLLLDFFIVFPFIWQNLQIHSLQKICEVDLEEIAQKIKESAALMCHYKD